VTPAPRKPLNALVVMGVSGSGKTTLAAMLAGRLGWPYRDADDFHPAANVLKMSSGRPLTDEDRAPWLAAIARWIDDQRAAGGHAIVACSALKRAYRDVLIGGRDDVRLVFLQGDRALVGARMAARRDHFMPTALLDSQFATLEAPTPDEQPVVVHVGGAPEEIVAAILSALDLAPVTKA
jgi:gluconokinase